MNEKTPIDQWLRALAERTKQFGRLPNYDREIHARLNEAADALRTHENGGQESEAGTVYQVEQIIGGVGYWLDVGKGLFDCETMSKTRVLFSAHPSAKAIETAALMKAVEVCRNLKAEYHINEDGAGFPKPKDYPSAILDLITPEGKTALEEFGMRVADTVLTEASIAGRYGFDNEELRAIVKQVMEGE